MASMVMTCITASRVRSSLFMVLGLVSDKINTAFSFYDLLRQFFFIFFYEPTPEAV